MRKIIKRFLIFCFICLFPFCATKKNLKFNFPQKIASISIERWTNGRMEAGSGATITINLKKPLSKSIQLEKIYFQGFETQIVQDNETNYKANFHFNTLYREHQSSEAASNNFNLKDNEAIIKYQKLNKTYYYKCRDIKEIPMIMYP